MGSKHIEVNQVGHFAEDLGSMAQTEVEEAEAALIMLLPKVRSVDGELLNEHQRECLYGVLQVGNISGKSDLLVAVLNCLERIGDVNALPFVEALASRPVDSSSVRRVKTAAENCLQTLRQIHAMGEPSESLLRPSEAALATTDTLLRPILGDTGSPETLIRPVSYKADDSPKELLRPEKPDASN